MSIESLPGMPLIVREPEGSLWLSITEAQAHLSRSGISFPKPFFEEKDMDEDVTIKTLDLAMSIVSLKVVHGENSVPTDLYTEATKLLNAAFKTAQGAVAS
jgi:hypothetical protein